MKRYLRAAPFALAAVVLLASAAPTALAISLGAYRSLTAFDRSIGFEPPKTCVAMRTGEPDHVGAEATLGFIVFCATIGGHFGAALLLSEAAIARLKRAGAAQAAPDPRSDQ